MKRLLTLFIFIFAAVTASFASSYAGLPACKAPGEGADPGHTAETPGHFTLPVGLPFGVSGSRDTNTSSSKKDTSGRKVIKGQVPSKKKVYQLSIGDDDNASTWRQTEEAFRQAQDMNADYILVHVGDDNAYSAVNKIKTRLYHYKTPVLLYVENRNKTSNSIIPLSKDTLAILKNVLSRNRERMPVKNERNKDQQGIKKEKYVSGQMLIPMTGKSCFRNINDETYFNKENISPTVKVTQELQQAGLENFDLIDYKPTAMGRLIDLLVSPFSVFTLVVILTAGFYFQFRSIGNGFPLFIAVCSGLLLFASGYFEGLTQSWEILLFLAGAILITGDVYLARGSRSLFPGILLVITGISFAALDPDVSLFSLPYLEALGLTLGAMMLSLLTCIKLEQRFISRTALQSRPEEMPGSFHVPLADLS
jgi:membrane-bound serine protease (ClpP class)